MPLRVARRVAACVVTVAVPILASVAHADPNPAACAAAYADAQIARQQGHLRQARDAARTCASPACPAVGRKDCATWSTELDREVPSIVVVAQEAPSGTEVEPTRVLIDGVARTDATGGRAIELDPGAHTLRVERTGDEPVSQSITIFQGERDRIVRVPVRPLAGASTAPSTPEPAPAPLVPTTAPPAAVTPAESSHATYVPAAILAGVSAVALGTSAWLGLTGRSQLSDLRTTCAPTCTDAQVDPVRTRLVVSDVTLGVGVLAAGASLYLFLRPPKIGGATVDVGLGRLGVRVAF